MVEQVRGWIEQRGIMFALITEWKTTTATPRMRRPRRRVVVPPMRDFSGVVRGYVIRSHKESQPGKMWLIGEGMTHLSGPVFLDAQIQRSGRFRGTFYSAGPWRMKEI